MVKVPDAFGLLQIARHPASRWKLHRNPHRTRILEGMPKLATFKSDLPPTDSTVLPKMDVLARIPAWSTNPIRMKSKDDGSRGPCGPDGSVTPRYITKKRNVRHGVL